MGILYNRLMIVLNDEEPGSVYYCIALAMLERLGTLSGLSIAEMAEACSVSKSSISKFIRRLGYEDYKEFRDAAIFEENKYQNDSNYVSNVMDFLDCHSLPTYVDTVCADLRETAKKMDVHAIDRLAHDLIRYERVAAFGLMFSETAAKDFQTKLGYNGKFIFTTMDDSKQDRFIKAAGPDTLIVVFSESGGFVDKYGSMIEDFSEKGVFFQTRARVVLISSNETMLRDPRIAYGIKLEHIRTMRTHFYTYQLVTDLVAHRYRELVREAHPSGGASERSTVDFSR